MDHDDMTMNMMDDHQQTNNAINTSALSLEGVNASILASITSLSQLERPKTNYTLFDNMLEIFEIVSFRHVVPSLFFFSWCVWGAFNIFARMHRQRIWGTPFVSQTCFVWHCMGGIPYASIVKSIGATYAVAHYVVRGYFSIHGMRATGLMVAHYRLRQFHHGAMLSGFCLQFWFEIGALWRPQNGKRGGRNSSLLLLRDFFITNVEYYALILAFLIETLVFYFHLDDRVNFDVQLHRVHICVIAATFFATIAESCFRRSQWVALLRWHTLMVQGIWMMFEEFAIAGNKLGFTKPDWWNDEKPNSVNYVAPVFVFSNSLSTVLLLSCSVAAYYAVHSKWFNELAMPPGSVDGSSDNENATQKQSLAGRTNRDACLLFAAKKSADLVR